MEAYKICACNTCDLPDSYIEANHLGIVSLSYKFGEDVYRRGDQELSEPVFYGKLRAGQHAETEPISYEYAKQFFEEILTETTCILQIAFSSGLSASCLNLQRAADALMKKKKGIKIIVIDSLFASLGEGLLVHRAVELKKKGKTMEEVAAWLDAHKQNLVHAFTVDDIYHLYLGDRISKASAVVGSVVNTKPCSIWTTQETL